MQGCILTRQDHDGGARGPGVDVWTARVRDFDLDLPAHAARVVVWDDLFSPDTLAADIAGARQRLADAFETDRAGESAVAVVLAGQGSPAAAVASVVGVPTAYGRIAVVDTNATGPTALSWKDLLPALRAHYGLVIGIGHVPLAGPRTWNAWLADNDMGDGLLRLDRDRFALCDAVVLTSDGLLGLGEDVDPGLRRTRAGDALSGFIDSLAAGRGRPGLAKRDEGAPTPRCFALASRATTGADDPVATRRLIDAEFGALRCDHPILLGPRTVAAGSHPSPSIALWAFDPVGSGIHE